MRWTPLAALAALGAVGYAAAYAAASDDPEGPVGPFRPVPQGPTLKNAFRASRAYAAPPEAVIAAAERAVRDLDGWRTGRPTSVAADGLRLDATFAVGAGFVDDVRLVAEPGPGGAVLYARSKSRAPGLDFGVNRARVGALLDAVGRGLGS